MHQIGHFTGAIFSASMIAKRHVAVGVTFHTYRAISSNLILKAAGVALSISAAARITEILAGSGMCFM